MRRTILDTAMSSWELAARVVVAVSAAVVAILRAIGARRGRNGTG